MTRRDDRVLALVIGGLLAFFFTVCSAFSVAGWSSGTKEHFDRQVIPGPIERLHVFAGAAEVSIVRADGDDVTIDSRVDGSPFAPKLELSVADGEVSVHGGCPEMVLGPCDATIVVGVPGDTAVAVDTSSGEASASGIEGHVTLRTGSGSISATDLPGGVDARTGSGDIWVGPSGGRLEIETGSGDINGDNLAATHVEALSSSGEVLLHFAAVPMEVIAESGSGDVTLEVPRDTYALDANAGSGDRDVSIGDTPGAPQTLQARTGSGDVTVMYAD